MGLDMYLYKQVSPVNAWEFLRKEHPDAIAKVEGLGIQQDRVDLIREKVGYWRKANHIHDWFVKHCQGGVDECQFAEVGIDQLAELLETCKQVRDDHSKATELLPTASGFFFGSTDYDEGYYSDIEDTILMIENLFAEPIVGSPWGAPSYGYRSSW